MVFMEAFLQELRDILPQDRIYTDELRTLAWGTDAGEYRLTPKVVIRSRDEAEVSQILTLASAHRIPLTFRAAGTSLSGQAISDSVLVVAGKNWEKSTYHPEDGSVTLQPGIVGREVNRRLAPYGRYFGPDPASIGSCMVGGIVSNNASGMSCGVHANSDMTLLSARIILADGTLVDTGDEASRAAFRRSHPELLSALSELRDRVLADPSLKARIERKYSIKNVTGLNLRPLVAYTDPFDILAHLMVGAEGTLGFLSEVTMATLPIRRFKAAAMVYFDDIVSAAKAVVALRGVDLNAAELLDPRSLASVKDPHLTAGKPGLTALLTEVQADSQEELASLVAAATQALRPFGVSVDFTDDSSVMAGYWAIRSGIFPTVGGLREEGTTCLIEDVAFHVDSLPEATADLSALLDRHGYTDSCIYGHALEGNFHFIVNQRFDTSEDIARYDEMIRDVVHLVVDKYDGSLKAEHGTGRNMASFVAYEWGEKAYGLMKRIKEVFDPLGILNPGVIFNDDSACYLKNLKQIPVLEPRDADAAPAYRQINKCIECGFCEVNCTSCGFTLSSRTRIVLQREIARRKKAGESYDALEKAFRYPGKDTCAGDGLCSLSCPMGINVADLTHQLRRESVGRTGRFAGAWVANHFSGAAHAVLGDKPMAAVGKGLHEIGLPLWTPQTPRPYRPKGLDGGSSERKVVYFPSCLNQMMGPSPKDPVRPLVEETVELLKKAGYEVLFPERMDQLCCGTIWESKGLPEIADRKVHELEEALWTASCEGRYPVLCDQSPCLHRMRQHIRKIHLYEPAEFILKFLTDRLDFHPVEEPVSVHITCSMRLMGLGDALTQLARRCSTKVTVPDGVGCCAFAGDKGMTHPELNAWALRKLRPALEASLVREGFSNSRTCEIGLSLHGGVPYRSIVYLVNRVTTAKPSGR